MTAGTTALRYRTLIDARAGFQAVPLDHSRFPLGLNRQEQAKTGELTVSQASMIF
ncbi:predicted protein [Streptomyces viridosporus ATCC 14672]|uniref:Predicted protein n=1 Tax=Streptomyces viridosporus (strain ATCC 14672 / DSM 40746 / JCM 4963 / KCTC 9882 / NRRL B-12104 / FH 1290) TaxID=566461 RepID=D5ZS58_STRV1|nr:predicted protein [Streptomyces viridosporus ATCC 14672]